MAQGARLYTLTTRNKATPPLGVVRAYWAAGAILDGSWQPPPVEKAAVGVGGSGR
jgi:hypothetical protein